MTFLFIGKCCSCTHTPGLFGKRDERAWATPLGNVGNIQAKRKERGEKKETWKTSCLWDSKPMYLMGKGLYKKLVVILMKVTATLPLFSFSSPSRHEITTSFSRYICFPGLHIPSLQPATCPHHWTTVLSHVAASCCRLESSLLLFSSRKRTHSSNSLLLR